MKVDKNFSYAVFISYAEVYNEKVRDYLFCINVCTPTILICPAIDF